MERTWLLLTAILFTVIIIKVKVLNVGHAVEEMQEDAKPPSQLQAHGKSSEQIWNIIICR